MRRIVWTFLFLGFLPGALRAETGQGGEALSWLEKIAAAAHQLNYSGTYVYQYGNRVETSRITHYVDGTGEREKLEALDGPPRELIRNNREVLCYLPEDNTVTVERHSARKFFPAILPERAGALGAYYTIKLGGHERVTGHECQVVLLEPKDAFRYGHKLLADVATGLLLKASQFNEKNELVDQFAFTQIDIGGPIDESRLKPNPSWKKLTWRTDPVVAGKADENDSNWVVSDLPPGFHKIMEMKRKLPGRKTPVEHMVYSDGLVAVSVFVEPVVGKRHLAEGFSSQGVINVYSRPIFGHQVTVLGEVPAATVMQIANSVSRKPR